MYLNIETPERFAHAIAEVKRGHDDYWLIMLADRHQNQLPEIVSALNEKAVPFVGAVFPGLIHNRNQYTDGAVVKQLPCIGRPTVIELGTDASQWFDKLPSAVEIGSH